MSGARILIVEDNADLAYGLRNNLEIEGHEVDLAADGREGLDRARAGGSDLIILDLTLPELGGYRVLRALRREGIDTPVLILTARGTETDKVLGFRLGADDYVTKPFGVLELLARVEALLRRTRTPGRPPPGSGVETPAPAPSQHGAGAALSAADDPETGGTQVPRTSSSGGAPYGQPGIAQRIRTFGAIVVDVDARVVEKDGIPVALTPKEFDLLLALMDREGRVASRIELMRDVWGHRAAIVSRTVDTHIFELRRKLEDDPSCPVHLLTVHKRGYRFRFVAPAGAPPSG